MTDMLIKMISETKLQKVIDKFWNLVILEEYKLPYSQFDFDCYVTNDIMYLLQCMFTSDFIIILNVLEIMKYK